MAVKLVKWLENQTYEEQLRSFGLKKRRLSKYLVTLYNYQKGGCKGVCQSLFLGDKQQDMKKRSQVATRQVGIGY